MDGTRALFNINTLKLDALLISTDEKVRKILRAVLLPDRMVMECDCEDGSQVIQVWETA